MQIPITSSLIAAADYDPQKQELAITFKSGARWVYGSEAQPFTPDDADAFMLTFARAVAPTSKSELRARALSDSMRGRGSNPHGWMG